MRTRTLAAASFVALAALAMPAAAQSTAAPAAPSASAPATEAWSAKPIGKYTLTMVRPDGQNMPVSVTVSDSAGALSALFWPVGDNDGHTMSVEVKGTDLVLNGQTPGGPLVITLQKHEHAVKGTWSFRGEVGAVTGTIDG